MRAERRKRATRVGAKVRYARLGRGATKRWGAAGARWAAARGRGLEDDRVRLGAACSCERESGGGSRGGTRGGATRKRHEGRCEGALREARGAARVRGGRRRVGVGWRTIG